MSDSAIKTLILVLACTAGAMLGLLLLAPILGALYAALARLLEVLLGDRLRSRREKRDKRRLRRREEFARKEALRRWNSLTPQQKYFESAGNNDVVSLKRALEEGHVDVDALDRDGQSALHSAFYRGSAEAIKTLKELGADENLLNREGLTPSEMAEVAAAEEWLRRTVSLISLSGSWSSVESARQLYELLTKLSSHVYNAALVRVVVLEPRTQQLLNVATKVGQPGSEERLGLALRGYGTKTMAEAYLNSGSLGLRRHGEDWLIRRGYTIIQTHGTKSYAQWGRF